jgi:hypothetical protein
MKKLNSMVTANNNDLVSSNLFQFNGGICTGRSQYDRDDAPDNSSNTTYSART